jgi:hypothetical protein
MVLMGAAEIFKADGTYIRFNPDDTIIVAFWANCDGCQKPHDKGQLMKDGYLWLCATCQ